MRRTDTMVASGKLALSHPNRKSEDGLFIEQGANSVTAMCTHAVLSGPAYDRINNSVLNKLIVTDTIPLKEESDKIEVVSVADLFSDVMVKAISHESISEHFVIA